MNRIIAALFLTTWISMSAADKPNIIIVFNDDMESGNRGLGIWNRNRGESGSGIEGIGVCAGYLVDVK